MDPLLATCHLLLVARYSLLSTHNLLLTAHYSLPTTHYSLLATHCSLFTIHCSLFTAHCSLLTAHCSLLATPCPLLTAHFRVLLSTSRWVPPSGVGISVAPVADRMILFNSHVEHAVLHLEPDTAQRSRVRPLRCAVTQWFQDLAPPYITSDL